MISIYGHSGSQNHGNEAIVRGICQLLSGKKINLYTFSPSVDFNFELDKVCNIIPFFDSHRDDSPRYSLEHIKHYCLKRYIKHKEKNDEWFSKKFLLNGFFSTINGVYLLEAGDQYFESKSLRNFYAHLNREINRRGGKTVMLGCTINEELLEDKKVLADLENYSLVIARESITYNGLVNRGLDEKKIFLLPDPAFYMPTDQCGLDSIFENEVIGINSGFLAQGNDVYYDLMIENLIELVKWILTNTLFNIALIPHVNWNEKYSDQYTLKKIYDLFDEKKRNRIRIVSEKKANQQKYVMSQCKFMISLRTHVAIPSIASQVPTLVTGYKVKSTGIVSDIFPNDFKLLADIASLKTNKDYIEHFKWMLENEALIRQYMAENIPPYIETVKKIKDLVLDLENRM